MTGKVSKEKERPESCPVQLWDSLGALSQQRAPASVELLWLQWNDLQNASQSIATVCDGIAKFEGKVVSRVSLAIRDRDSSRFLWIIDASKGPKKFAAFHQCERSYAGLAHACFRVQEGLADWRERTERTSKQGEDESSPYTSGAF